MRFSSAFRPGTTEVKADDDGFDGNIFGTGLAGGVMTGRCCFVQELSLAGHTTPGAAGMGGTKVC